MRDPDTPGGFKDNIACRAASSSATADDMADKVLMDVMRERV